MGTLSNNAVAFYIGLFGSIHCIGMCGPLAFAIPGNTTNKWLLFLDKLIYQLGRVCSYTILGLIIGSIGRQLWLLGFQRSLSLLSGGLIILAASARWLKSSFFKPANPTRLFGIINKLIGMALKRRWGHFAIGMLNGLLPCGFVYIALLGAVNTQSISTAMQYMASFGLGTLPLMFLAAVGSGFITASLRTKLNKVVPYFMLCLGLWFILRGLGLNIPYLSPVMNDGVTCH